MSRKYIGQVDNQNFVFPNNSVPEYDVNIIHDINDNCVSGSVINFSGTTVGDNMVISFDYIWDLNGATPYVRNSSSVAVLSVHAMAPNEVYYKPYKTVGRFVFTDIPITRIESGVTPGFNRLSFTITPASLGISSVDDGVYYFEIRFLGERCVFPVCFAYNYLRPTPTPTPTPTSTATPTPTSTPTITPTPTSTPEGPTPTPTSTPIGCTEYTVGTTSGSGQSYTYITCDGIEAGGTIGGAGGYDADTFCAQTDTVVLVGGELSLSVNGTCPGIAIEAQAFGSMEPCIGGTIDDYMGASITLDNPVTVDTNFDVTVWYKDLGNSCDFPNITTGAYSTSFTVMLQAGDSIGDVDACTQGQYFPSGANICGACVTSTDNTIDTITFSNPGGC
jgi:hypothetical protein